MKTIVVTVANVNGNVLFGEPTIAVVRIIDDDPSPTLEISDVIVPEGGSGLVQALATSYRS